VSLCRIIEFRKDSTSEFAEVLSKAASRGKSRKDPSVAKTVAKTIEDVRRSGWQAAIKLTRKYDAPGLRASQFEVSSSELKAAEIPAIHYDAIRESIRRVTAFHERQLDVLTAGWTHSDLSEGVPCWKWTMPATSLPGTGYEGQRLLPIASVGLYIPGGKASYPSSVIMNAVPAKVAGVNEIILCTPPRPDGSISPVVLVAARELGIETIVKCGGAQAIALMALGPYGERQTNKFFSWTPVQKVVGPGNKWVNEAKRQLWGQVGLDTFAGPSEVCIFATEDSNPDFAAADWLTQIEHAEDNVGYLLTNNRVVAERVIEAAERQLAGAPRETIMRQALAEHGLVIIGWMSDVLAAEHVSLMVSNPEAALKDIRDGGCVLMGDYTPQSAGDFCSGPSHTLPTGGAARFGGPVNVMDFLKFQSISSLTKEDLRELLPTIEAFGEMEGFPQHARGATIRFEDHSS
jgi:histidinol dehydrogenase